MMDGGSSVQIMRPVIQIAPGTLLGPNGRYRIHSELNRGGTAVVYAAEDMSSPGAYVALKVMNGPEQVPIKVVKREIAFSASRGAQHANIVKLLDVFAHAAQLVIVWELISGPDLLDLLNEHHGRMPEPMAAFYFCQLLQAAQYMHDNGYAHRDIKPENCMVQRSNHTLKLVDFGLTKHLESAKTLGVGTPDYLSPEMLQAYSGSGVGGGGYDARAVDAWACGVMMFLLCTGRYPFEDPRYPNNLSHTIQNVLSGRMLPPPPTMSPGCQGLIAGLLRTDPKQRTTLQELAENEWLLSQACAYGNQVGQLDLLAPLLSLRQQLSAKRREAACAGAATANVEAVEGSADHSNHHAAAAPEKGVEESAHSRREKPRTTLSKVCSFFKRNMRSM